IGRAFSPVVSISARSWYRVHFPALIGKLCAPSRSITWPKGAKASRVSGLISMVFMSFLPRAGWPEFARRLAPPAGFTRLPSNAGSGRRQVSAPAGSPAGTSTRHDKGGEVPPSCPSGRQHGFQPQQRDALHLPAGGGKLGFAV